MQNQYISQSSLDPFTFAITYPTYEGEMTMPTKKQITTLFYYEEAAANPHQPNIWFLTEDESLANSKLNSSIASLQDIRDAGCAGMELPYGKIIQTESKTYPINVEYQTITTYDAIGREESYEDFAIVW